MVSRFLDKYGTEAVNNIKTMTDEEMMELIRNVGLKEGNREAVIGARLIFTVALFVAKETLLKK